MFHNTTHEIGETLTTYRQRAASQEERILLFYQENQGIAIPPHIVWERVFGKEVPITSVRRAITDLTIMGKLAKAWYAKFLGPWGRMTYGWQCPGPETDND
jgi:hypothetical protein